MAAVELSTACAVLLAWSEAFRQRAADLRREAERAAQEQGVSITFVATRGDPLTELHRIAREIRADTIIVGASTKAGHRLVGSLSARLVRAGKWPIMVVP
jgi:nucleotide-binding universal stress UspA family protein